MAALLHQFVRYVCIFEVQTIVPPQPGAFRHRRFVIVSFLPFEIFDMHLLFAAFKVGVNDAGQGSAYVELGLTKVLATV